MVETTAISTPQPKWSVGILFGVGARYQPPRAIPDGILVRPELFTLTLRHTLEKPIKLLHPYQRIDVQLNLYHSYVTQLGTTRARLPIGILGSNFIPTTHRSRLVYSTGAYTEIGRDRFVVDEKLVKRVAGTVAFAGRVGLERQRGIWKNRTAGLYWNAMIGLNLGRDPDHLLLSQYIRFGAEWNVSWGWGHH